jgi:NitT/TauT family transport system permease protein
MRRGSGRFFGQVLPPILVLLIVAGGLEAYVRWRNVPEYLLPRPSAVLLSLRNDRAELLTALLWTTIAAVIGFIASAIFGIFAAVLLAGSKLVRRAIYPYTLFFQTVPIVAIAPLLVFWLEAGLESVAVCAFIVSVFPVIANTLTGLLSTDRALVDLFRLYGGGPIARFWKLRLPAALPSLFTGLRVAAGLAVIGTVVAEFLVGLLGDRAGLGIRIVSGIKYGRTDRVFAAVLLASLLGLGLFLIVNAIAYVTLRRWHVSERE